MKNKQMKIKIENDELVISIGVDIIKHAVTVGRSYGLCDVKITDENKFLNALCTELKVEEEDGTNRIHRVFDDAVSSLLEDPDGGIELNDDAA
jgi:hypothetical protein